GGGALGVGGAVGGAVVADLVGEGVGAVVVGGRDGGGGGVGVGDGAAVCGAGGERAGGQGLGGLIGRPRGVVGEHGHVGGAVLGHVGHVVDRRGLVAFPTRRSSDLGGGALGVGGAVGGAVVADLVGEGVGAVVVGG